MKMIDALKSNSQILNAKLESSKLYVHNGLRGTCREEDLINVIRDCIPECYGMKAGQIFSSDNKISKQIDVVIFDTIFSNYFKKDSSAYLFPCESVYGSIEVKTMLNKESFEEAIANIKSVRELNREKANCLDITPIRHIDLSKETFRYNEDRTNEYLNIIFAYDSVNEDTLIEYIINLNYDYELLPTFIYVHKKGLIFSKVYCEKSQTKSVEKTYLGMNHKINNKYALSKYGEDGMTAFFILLNAMLEQIQLKAIDYTKLCNNELNDIKKEVDVSIN